MVSNTELLDLARDVPPDGQGRVICPECNGGSTRERSLSIRKEGLGVHFNCWRANCTFTYRRVLMDGSTARASPTTQPSRRTFWDRPTTMLEGLAASEFNMNFYDTPLPIRVTGDGRAVIPMLDMMGVRRGDIVRQPKPYNNDIPKSLSLYELGYSGIAWFVPEQDITCGTLCCVEDPLSAMRLCKHGIVGVALLGTSLTRPKLRDIQGWTGYREEPIHLALDADAQAHARRQARLLRNQADIRVHRLYRDVKDMDSEELRNFLGVLGV